MYVGVPEEYFLRVLGSSLGCQLPVPAGLLRDPPPSGCCKPGPPLPPSATLKNVLIIGDSVSIGYTSYATPNVPDLLSDVALAQHGHDERVREAHVHHDARRRARLDAVTAGQAPIAVRVKGNRRGLG